MSEILGRPILVRPFTTHHEGEHCVLMWEGVPWLFWRHPDGEWVSECKVEVAARLAPERGDSTKDVDRLAAVEEVVDLLAYALHKLILATDSSELAGGEIAWSQIADTVEKAEQATVRLLDRPRFDAPGTRGDLR